MAGNPRSPMRLLPDRPDHAGHRASAREKESQRPGYRHRDVRQHLPLRHVPANSCSHPPGREGDGMRLIENVSLSMSRRGFLHGALMSGVFVLSARYVPEPVWAAEGEAAAAFDPGVWLSIGSDGAVSIVAHRSEMGCGSRTALPLVVADELDADWAKVKIEQAIGDPKYGDQDTDGSHSVRSYFDLMWQVGATGRVMLITAAANEWKVPAKECTTERHFVVHRATGRKLAYGELAGTAAKLPIPKKEDVPLPLKARSEWRYIGKESNSL